MRPVTSQRPQDTGLCESVWRATHHTAQLTSSQEAPAEAQMEILGTPLEPGAGEPSSKVGVDPGGFSVPINAPPLSPGRRGAKPWGKLTLSILVHPGLRVSFSSTVG